MKLRELDSFLPSPVQMAPSAAQSVVAGSSMVTSPLPCGFISMRQGMLLGLSRSLRLLHGPARHVEGVGLQGHVAQAELLAELDLEGELGRAIVGPPVQRPSR